MVAFPTIRHKPLIAIFFVAISCSIIQDGDIKSAEELSKLKLTSFQIAQTTNSGNSTVTATMTYDSVKNFVDTNTGMTIARRVEYSLPPLGNLKMKLRSGTTASTRLRINYTDTKKVFSMRILQLDSTVELYRFFYSSSGQLIQIKTFMDPVDGLPLTLVIDDIFTYTGNTISTITRNFNGSPSTHQITYGSQGSGSYVTQIANGTQGYSNSGGCSNSNSNPYACTIYYPQSGGGPQVYMYTTLISNSLDQLSLQDQRNNSGGGGSNNREADTYYFHPLMILRNQVASGDHLLVMYLMDWWSIGATINNPPPFTDEKVIFRYTYGF